MSTTVNMVKIGQKIRLGLDWPHLAPLGFKIRVLGMTFTRFDSKLAPMYVWCAFGKNHFMGTHFLAITEPLELGKTFPFESQYGF